jgi:CubicO group peptidase (beta-lactamase class C family)
MVHLNEGAMNGSERAGRQVLQPNSVREMQRAHALTSTGDGYGLGWQIHDDQRGFRRIEHTGGMPGVTTVLSLFPAERVVVVVLANQQSDLIVPLARRVAGVLVPASARRLPEGR